VVVRVVANLMEAQLMFRALLVVLVEVVHLIQE
jgi:hypothetical protein